MCEQGRPLTAKEKLQQRMAALKARRVSCGSAKRPCHCWKHHSRMSADSQPSCFSHQLDARKDNHQEVVEEDRKAKLPANYESRKRRCVSRRRSAWHFHCDAAAAAAVLRSLGLSVRAHSSPRPFSLVSPTTMLPERRLRKHLRRLRRWATAGDSRRRSLSGSCSHPHSTTKNPPLF